VRDWLTEVSDERIEQQMTSGRVHIDSKLVRAEKARSGPGPGSGVGAVAADRISWRLEIRPYASLSVA
jgi:hypothetical protein